MAGKARGESVARLAERLGVELEPKALAALERFAALVARWSRRVDLVAATEPGARAEILFVDALVAHDVGIVPTRGRLLDVGAGVGAPTLPLLLLHPSLEATLVEPRRKRVAFLRSAVGELDLFDRVRVIETRLPLDPEAARAQLGEPCFDLALSRATFAPDTWLELGLGLASQVLVLTAQQPPPAAPGAVTLALRHAYRIPSTGAARQLALYRRE